MKLGFKIEILAALALSLFSSVASAQFEGSASAFEKFYFDAVCFRATNSDTASGRLDVYALIPYQTLNFENADGEYVAKYELRIEIIDDNDVLVRKSAISRTESAKSYFSSQGGDGEFSPFFKSFFLPPGKYSVRAFLTDKLNGMFYSKSRETTVIDFKKYDFSLSGVLLLSSIEDVGGGKFKIVPRVSDNVGDLDDGFFIFFEIYADNFFDDSVDFVYELYKRGGSKPLFVSKKFSAKIDGKITRKYKKVKLPLDLEQGKYDLKLIALKKRDYKEVKRSDYLAITERSIKFFRTISGYFTKDIDKAVRFLRYVANQSDIDYINSASSKAEKLRRFEEFWKKLDPTPNTEKNEAFEEYYSRIAFANKHFKSYTEGWLTDMGRIYVIFGPPDFQDKQTSYDGRITYLRWTYKGLNREFLFVDYSGMGDFRLASDFPITEKYRYYK